MKKTYVDPEATIVQFETEDIITMSGGDNDANVGGGWGDTDLG